MSSIGTTLKIDGVLDEPAWSRAALLTGFSQYRPVDGRPAEDSTDVLAWYAPDAIYFGIRAFEPHGHVVRATLADRDNIDADDHVAILLDTYLDHRRATMFAVNPLGVQEDGVWSDGVAAGAAGGPSAGGRFDATIDLNPDYVYQSRGRVTERGYEVEAPIPRIGASRSSGRCSTRDTRRPGPPRYAPTRASSFSRAAWSASARCGAAWCSTSHPSSPPRWTVRRPRRATTTAARPRSPATCAGGLRRTSV